MIVDFLQEVVSTIILNSFLTGLFILSLWNNYITVHFKKKHDPRDIRKSSTTIHQHDHEGKIHPLSSQTIRRETRTSISSRSPLNIEMDEENNIEYDHTISVVMTEDTTREMDKNNNAILYDNDNDNNPIDTNPFDDVLAMEDRKLVPSLKYYYNQYNIDIEEYQVETDDGFIIDLWHFVPLNMTIEEKERTYKEKYPILMVHGLLQSSGSFASCGRKSLAYYMYESGFDVWLGNNRCGFNPKWNTDIMKKFYGKESKLKFKKWDWDINEMTKYDIKSFIEFILDKKPDFDKLTLISHSQGTTQAFMGLVNGPTVYSDDDDDANRNGNNENTSGFSLLDKIDNYIALAPAIYPGPLLNEKIFVRLMGAGIDNPWIFGRKSFIPIMMQMRNIAVGSKPFSFLSYIMFNYLFDWNDMLWDKSLRDRNFLFSPVNISVKLMQWWLSPDPTKNSFKYCADKIFPPEKTWFPISSRSDISENEGITFDRNKPLGSPHHLNKTRDNSESFPRIMLFVPKQDRLVDGEKLINHFINHEDKSIYRVWYIDEYSHLDVLWAHDVIDRIGKPILENMRLPYDKLEQNK